MKASDDEFLEKLLAYPTENEAFETKKPPLPWATASIEQIKDDIKKYTTLTSDISYNSNASYNPPNFVFKWDETLGKMASTSNTNYVLQPQDTVVALSGGKVSDTIESSDFVALSSVKGHYTHIKGKIVYVREYKNKLERKAVFDVQHSDQEQVSAHLPGHGLLHFPAGTKLASTGSGNVVALVPDAKTLTFKKDGGIVPTASSMKEAADTGNLYHVHSIDNKDVYPTSVASTNSSDTYDLKPGEILYKTVSGEYLLSIPTEHALSGESGPQSKLQSFNMATFMTSHPYTWNKSPGTIIAAGPPIEHDTSNILPPDSAPTAPAPAATKVPPKNSVTVDVPGHGPTVLKAGQSLHKTALGNHVLSGPGFAVLLHSNGQTAQPKPIVLERLEKGELELVAKGPEPTGEAGENVPTTLAEAMALIKGVKANLSAAILPSQTVLAGSYDHSLSRVEKFANEKVRKGLLAVAADLKPLSKWGEGQITKANKMAVGKERSRLELLATASQAAEDVLNATTPEQITEALNKIVKLDHSHANVAFGKFYGVKVWELHAAIHRVGARRAYEMKLEAAGLESPHKADHPTLLKIAADNGLKNAEHLDVPTLTTTVAAILGDPDVHVQQDAVNSGQNQANFLAAKSAAVAALALHTSQKPQTISGPAQVLGDLETHKYKSLHTEMLGSGGVHWKWDSAASQYDSVGLGTSPPLSPGDLVYAADAGHLWPAPGSPPLFPALSSVTTEDAQTKKAQYDVFYAGLSVQPANMSTAEINGLVKSLGGNYVGKMSNDDKKLWIRLHALGDNVAKYNLEQDSANKGANPVTHLLSETHPGSPNSVSGKKAREILATLVAASPHGDAVFAGQALSPMQWAEFRDHLAIPPNTIAYGEWLGTHLPLDPPTFIEPDLTPSLPPIEGVSEEVKDLVAAAEATDDPELTKHLTGDLLDKIHEWEGDLPAAVQPAPPNIKVLYQWASSLHYGSGASGISSNVQAIISGINTRAQAGAYAYHKGVNSFLPKNASSPHFLAPGDKVFQHDGGYIIKPLKGPSKGLSFSGYPETVPAQPKGTVLITQAPLPGEEVSLPKALNEGLSVTQDDWDYVEALEAQNPNSFSMSGVPAAIPDAELDIALQSYGTLTPAQLKTLPKQIKKAALGLSLLLTNGQPSHISLPTASPHLNIIAYKASKGYYNVPKIDESKSYATQMASGSTEAYNISYGWTAEQKNAYINDHQLFFGTVNSAIAQGIAKHISQTYGADANLPKVSTVATQILFTKKPGQGHNGGLGGMHSKSIWLDQQGQEWMAKAFPTDPNGDYRVDAEHHANLIGRLIGGANPETRTHSLEGKHSYVQRLLPAISNAGLKGLTPSDLSDEQLANAMAAHVTDWIVSNHDTHGGNLLLSPDGKSVIHIDLGQAFKFFPKDKLAVGYQPNPEPAWFDLFYTDLASGKISKERADLITTKVLARARRAATKHDDKYREYLELALAKRKGWPSEYPSKKAFIDALMERKHSTLDDFIGLYKGLYKKAGYDFDEETLAAPSKAKVEDRHFVGMSDDLLTAVDKQKIHGVASFFGGRAVEDGHILFFTETAADGSTTLRAELKLRKEADQAVTAWLKSQSITDQYKGAQSGVVSQPVQPLNSEGVLPNNDIWHSAVVAGIKTVNSHVSDGAYNQSTLDDLTAKLALMEDAQKHAAQVIANPDDYHFKKNTGGTIGSHKFQSLEHLEAWKSMLDDYVVAANQVLQAHQDKAKYAGQKPLDKATYTPKIKAPEPSSPDEDGEKSFGGSNVAYSLSKDKSGKWSQKILSTGEEFEITPDAAKHLIETDALDEQTVSQISAGAKSLTLFRRHSTGSLGTFDPKTGTLLHTGSDLADGYKGLEYDVEHSDGSLIEYRPWEESATVLSQKGLMRISVPNYTGGTDRIDDALETIKTMGVDLSPADEQQMELLYWRMVSDQLGQRAATGKMAILRDKAKKILSDSTLGTISEDDELTSLKAAWAEAIGQDKVDAADHLPRYGAWRNDPLEDGGQPHWFRPDMTLQDVYDNLSDKNTLPKMFVKSENDIVGIAETGGVYSFEQRLRALGKYLGGMSSGTDQTTGGSSFIFTRINKRSGQGAYSTPTEVFLHPNTFRRTGNMAFNSDVFGRVSSAPTGAPADAASALKHTNSTNETDIKYGASLLRDIVAVRCTSSTKAKAIAALADKGITEIRGVPVSEIFTTSTAEADAAVKKAWAAALKAEKEGTDV